MGWKHSSLQQKTKGQILVNPHLNMNTQNRSVWECNNIHHLEFHTAIQERHKIVKFWTSAVYPLWWTSAVFTPYCIWADFEPKPTFLRVWNVFLVEAHNLPLLHFVFLVATPLNKCGSYPLWHLSFFLGLSPSRCFDLPKCETTLNDPSTTLTDPQRPRTTPDTTLFLEQPWTPNNPKPETRPT